MKVAAQKEKKNFNFVLVPLLAPGHMIPMIDMAKVLAQEGVMATIITTTMNAVRFEPAITRAAESGLSIRILHLEFPSEEVGLPKGCECADNLPSYDLVKNMRSAIDMLQKPIEKIIQDQTPSPCCIICDKHYPWAAEAAGRCGIPWISFDGMSCFTQLCTHILRATKVHETTPDGQPFLVPGMGDGIEFTRSQLPRSLISDSLNDVQEKVARERVRAGETEAYGSVVNSFQELEGEYADEYIKLKKGRVWCIGPLSLCNKNAVDKAQRGSRSISLDREQAITKWLDLRDPGSVVYTCLGSLSRLTMSEFTELASGLESSNRPFIMAVKGEKTEEIEKWIVKTEFEERTKERGLLIWGWAPQVLILSHSSIGAFLTHCGWNSTLEGICAAVPMITRPLFAEQFFNEKMVVNVLKIGVSVGAKLGRQLGEEEKPGMGVCRDDYERAINRVMDGGDSEAVERRRRAKELGEMAHKAVAEDGSSRRNISLLVEEIMELASTRAKEGKWHGVGKQNQLTCSSEKKLFLGYICKPCHF